MSNEKKTPKKPLLFGIFIGLLLALIVSAFALTALNDRYAFLRPDGEVTVTVTAADTPRTVARQLKEGGVVKLAWMLARSIDTPLQEGKYTVPRDASYRKIRAILQRQEAMSTVTLTFAEGATVDRILTALTDAGVGNYARYVEVINTYPFEYDWLPTMQKNRVYRLEGYLYPDTYEFYQNAKEETVIAKFLANFDRKFDADYRAMCRKKGMSVDEAVTMASVIQAEVKYVQEYPLVSSVLHNRTRAGRRWESDATVRYAVSQNEALRPVTPQDLKTEHPYNTYLHAGYPPSAICNPGREAMAYALCPRETNYFYFVSAPNGKTLFAENYATHLQNIEKVSQT